MGLDMILERVIFTFDNDDDKVCVSYKKNDKELFNIKNGEGVSIHQRVGYWQKANQIHGWFVDNVQAGKDDCKEYEVEESQLLTLKNICERILKDKTLAEELLPPQEGFFFGNTNINEYYFEDLKQTITIIDKAIADQKKLDKKDVWSYFTYHSSW